MSGWTILNIEVPSAEQISGWNWRVDGDPRDEVRRSVHEYSDGHVHSKVYHKSAVIKLSGYREWEQDEAMLKQTPNVWDEAVVIQANDTADVGTARHYVRSDDSLRFTHEYQERQADGHHVGDRAAAAMFTTHNIACMGNFCHPYHWSEQSGEWEEDK